MMLSFLRFLFGMVIRLKVVLLSALAGAGIVFGLQLRQDARTWGLDPADQARGLPGDDLVKAPDHVETRSLVIDALPSTVWPLLTRLGHGRGGWYSWGWLDRAWSPMGDMASQRRTRPASEPLEEGDLVLTQAGGGLVVKEVDPEHALVLYVDDAAVRDQIEQEAASGSKQARRALEQLDEMPPFGLSWAFVLEPEQGGRTRLVERVRLQMDARGGQKRALPLMGLGLFAFIRQQMLGIKRRVEAGAG
jgi:hypothetical protein